WQSRAKRSLHDAFGIGVETRGKAVCRIHRVCSSRARICVSPRFGEQVQLGAAQGGGVLDGAGMGGLSLAIRPARPRRPGIVCPSDNRVGRTCWISSAVFRTMPCSRFLLDVDRGSADKHLKAGVSMRRLISYVLGVAAAAGAEYLYVYLTVPSRT